MGFLNIPPHFQDGRNSEKDALYKFGVTTVSVIIYFHMRTRLTWVVLSQDAHHYNQYLHFDCMTCKYNFWPSDAKFRRKAMIGHFISHQKSHHNTEYK